VGDRILALRREWLDMILSGEKTVEIRGYALRQGGIYFLGSRGNIYGSVVIGEGAWSL